MVYRGKPSKGCATCRKRKIRCSGEHPQCRNCQRLGQKCPGYRNQLDLQFCDESKSVASQYHVRGKKHLSFPATWAALRFVSPEFFAQSGSNSPKSHYTHMHRLATSLSRVSRQLTSSAPNHAIAFFFSHYVLNDQSYHSYNDFVPELYSQERENGMLHAAVMSVGLAGLAGISKCHALLQDARKQYSLALRLINTALGDPIKSKQDDTLATVLIMALFENVTCDSQRSIQSWQLHIDGCMALIGIRGHEQFKRNMGKNLFCQLKLLTTISFLQKGKSPSHLHQSWYCWVNEIRRIDTEKRDHFVEHSQLLVKFCKLEKSAGQADSAAFIQQCERLDNEIAMWAMVFGPGVAPTTVVIKSPRPDVLRSEYHVYPNIETAYHWNNHRLGRILLNGRLAQHYKAASETDPSSTEKYSKAIFVMRRLIYDVCASVPFHFGLREKDPVTPRAAGALFIVSHIFVIANLDVSAGKIRNWCIERLQAFWRDMGFKQAGTLADVLQKREAKIKGDEAIRMLNTNIDYNARVTGKSRKAIS